MKKKLLGRPYPPLLPSTTTSSNGSTDAVNSFAELLPWIEARDSAACRVCPEIGVLFPGQAADGMDAVPTSLYYGCRDAIYRIRLEQHDAKSPKPGCTPAWLFVSDRFFTARGIEKIQ
jgi:hypothetical protein